MTDDLSARARTLLQTSLVWDNHACMPMRPNDASYLPRLSQFRSAGADVISLNIGFGPMSLDEHIRVAASYRRWLADHADDYVLVDTLADIDRAREEGKLAVTFDIEGMGPLNDGDHGLVDLFHHSGVRWMLVAYNRNNAVGGGCHDDDPGLTPFGREVLKEMKRVGMVVCCSHTGHRTVMDVMEAADNPVIFSHSNPLAMANHARNIPDSLIRACAATDGVVGINGIGFFLGENDTSPRNLVRHIDHVVQLVGPRHVGLGLDYVFDQEELADVLVTMKDTFPDPAAYAGVPNLAGPEVFEPVVAGLLGLGYGDADIAGILGGNWRRVAETVWR